MADIFKSKATVPDMVLSVVEYALQSYYDNYVKHVEQAHDDLLEENMKLQAKIEELTIDRTRYRDIAQKHQEQLRYLESTRK